MTQWCREYFSPPRNQLNMHQALLSNVNREYKTPHSPEKYNKYVSLCEAETKRRRKIFYYSFENTKLITPDPSKATQTSRNTQPVFVCTCVHVHVCVCVCVCAHARHTCGQMYVRHEIQQITITCDSAASKLGLSTDNYSSPAAHKPPSVKGKVRWSVCRRLGRKRLPRSLAPSLPRSLARPYNIRQISHLSYKVPLTFRRYEGPDRAS